MNKFTRTLAISITAFCALNAQAETQEGYYSVPVPSHLLPFAKFDLGAVETESAGGELQKISYVLPAELTGRTEQVTLIKTGLVEGETEFKSADGASALCLKNICRTHYRNLKINTVVRDAFLMELSKSPEELSARIAVAQSFSGDPAGVLEIKDTDEEPTKPSGSNYPPR